MITIIKYSLLRSLRDVKEYPIVFVPAIIYIFLSVLGIMALFVASGVLPLLKDITNQPEEVIQQPFEKFLGDNLAKFLSSLIIFGIGAFVVGSSLTAMKFHVVALIMKQHKPTFSMLLAGWRMTWRIIIARVLQLLYYLVSLVAGIVVFILFYSIHPKIAFFLSAGVFLSGIIVTFLMFFFLYPYMFLKNLRPYESILTSARFFLKNKKFAISVFLVFLLVIAAIDGAAAILDLLTLKKISIFFSLLSYFVTTSYLPLFLFRVFSQFKQP